MMSIAHLTVENTKDDYTTCTVHRTPCKRNDYNYDEPSLIACVADTRTHCFWAYLAMSSPASTQPLRLTSNPNGQPLQVHLCYPNFSITKVHSDGIPSSRASSSTNGAASNAIICGITLNHSDRLHPHPIKRPTIEGWKKTFATELISYSIDCWQHRNDKLHGALDILHDTQHRKLLHKRVRQLYKESSILTRPDDKRYFHMPCRLRVKQRHVTLETWADTVGLIIIRHRERTARETLDTWIMQRPGTTHSP